MPDQADEEPTQEVADHIKDGDELKGQQEALHDRQLATVVAVISGELERAFRRTLRPGQPTMTFQEMLSRVPLPSLLSAAATDFIHTQSEFYVDEDFSKLNIQLTEVLRSRGLIAHNESFQFAYTPSFGIIESDDEVIEPAP